MKQGVKKRSDAGGYRVPVFRNGTYRYVNESTAEEMRDEDERNAGRPRLDQFRLPPGKPRK